FESDVLGRWAARRPSVPVLTSLVNTSYGPARRADPNVRAWRLQVVRAVDGWTARHLTTHFHAVTAAVKAAAVDALHIRAARVSRAGAPARELAGGRSHPLPGPPRRRSRPAGRGRRVRVPIALRGHGRRRDRGDGHGPADRGERHRRPARGGRRRPQRPARAA